MLGWGSFSGVISPTLVGYIVQYTGSFNAAYYIFAIVSALGCLLSLALIVKEKAVLKQTNHHSQTDNYQHNPDDELDCAKRDFVEQTFADERTEESRQSSRQYQLPGAG